MLFGQFVDYPNLIKDLCGGEISHAFEVTRCTEFTIQGATHLRTDTGRCPAACGNHHTFNFVAIVKLKGHFDGTVF